MSVYGQEGVEQIKCTICGFMCLDQVFSDVERERPVLPHKCKMLSYTQHKVMYPTWLRNELVRLFPEAREMLESDLVDDGIGAPDLLLDEPVGSVAEFYRQKHYQEEEEQQPALPPAQLLRNEEFMAVRRLKRAEDVPLCFQRSLSTFLAFQLPCLPAVCYREAYAVHSTPLYARSSDYITLCGGGGGGSERKAQRPPSARRGGPPRRSSAQDRNEAAKLHCPFCRKNGETRGVYTSHGLLCPVTRVVTCPILRSYVCQACQATGDFAHTRSYCPRVKEQQGSVRSTTVALKSTRHQSNGSARAPNSVRHAQRVSGRRLPGAVGRHRRGPPVLLGGAGAVVLRPVHGPQPALRLGPGVRRAPDACRGHAGVRLLSRVPQRHSRGSHGLHRRAPVRARLHVPHAERRHHPVRRGPGALPVGEGHGQLAAEVRTGRQLLGRAVQGGVEHGQVLLLLREGHSHLRPAVVGRACGQHDVCVQPADVAAQQGRVASLLRGRRLRGAAVQRRAVLVCGPADGRGCLAGGAGEHVRTAALLRRGRSGVAVPAAVRERRGVSGARRGRPTQARHQDRERGHGAVRHGRQLRLLPDGPVHGVLHVEGQVAHRQLGHPAGRHDQRQLLLRQGHQVLRGLGTGPAGVQRGRRLPGRAVHGRPPEVLRGQGRLRQLRRAHDELPAHRVKYCIQ